MIVSPVNVGIEDLIPIRRPCWSNCTSWLIIDPGAFEEGSVLDEIELGAFVELYPVVCSTNAPYRVTVYLAYLPFGSRRSCEVSVLLRSTVASNDNNLFNPMPSPGSFCKFAAVVKGGLPCLKNVTSESSSVGAFAELSEGPITVWTHSLCSFISNTSLSTTLLPSSLFSFLSSFFMAASLLFAFAIVASSNSRRKFCAFGVKH